jgi:hypothetical protein
MNATRFFGRVCVVVMVNIVALSHARAENLPVFKLAPPEESVAAAAGVAPKFIGRSDDKLTFASKGNTLTYKSGHKVFEVDRRSGFYFFGDMSQLWSPQANPELPSAEAARAVSDRFLKQNNLLPTADRSIEVAFLSTSATMGGSDTPGALDKRQLDQQIHSIGDGGAIIGFNGGWRMTTGVASEEEIISQEQALSEVKKRAANAELRNLTATLAYYSAPAFERQEVLAPVWIVNGNVQVGEESYPLRTQIIAATKFGPVLPKSPAFKPREIKVQPNLKIEDERVPARQGLLDFIITPAYASPGFDCGTSWIGASQGLGGSAGNRQGFIDGCRAAGWNVLWDWGDANAWESDFNANDDNWVDTADLVFYTGHASQNGWVLNTPSDTSLNYTEVAGTPDLYGNQELEWLIIAACGPLQSSHFVSSTTNAFDRWRPIFDGMHVFMGYGAVTYDNTDEGRRFMELTRAGWNVIDAWFRTAQDIQPATNGESAPNGPTIFVVAMYAHNGDHCARNDHLWGMGTGCADVSAGSGQQRYMLWSGT